jgi:hypothetical protein
MNVDRVATWGRVLLTYGLFPRDEGLGVAVGLAVEGGLLSRRHAGVGRLDGPPRGHCNESRLRTSHRVGRGTPPPTAPLPPTYR